MPYANAGPDQNVKVNQTVYLDASGSYDPEANKTTYQWDFGDGNSTGWINNANTTHKYTQIGNYTATLKVSDGYLNETDTCQIQVTAAQANNSAPISDAGLDQNTTTNQTVTFDGSGSYDPEGDTLTYLWDFGDGASTNWQSSPNASHAYAPPGNYTATLSVTDGFLYDNDTCFVNVSSPPPVNQAPSANAGSDIVATVNQTIKFDGSNSSDPDGDTLTYNWIYGDGWSTGWQSNPNSTHSYSSPGNYTATLNVSDGSLYDNDTCLVTVNAIPPPGGGGEGNDSGGDAVNGTGEDTGGGDGNDTGGGGSSPGIGDGGDQNATFNKSALEMAIAAGLVGGVMNIDRSGLPDMDFLLEGFEMELRTNDDESIEFLVRGEHEEGLVFVINVQTGNDFQVMNLHDIGVMIDGTSVLSALFTTVLAAEGEEALYCMIVSVEATQILVYIPHFSEHVVSIDKLEAPAGEPDESTDNTLIFAYIGLLAILMAVLFSLNMYFLRRAVRRGGKDLAGDGKEEGEAKGEGDAGETPDETTDSVAVGDVKTAPGPVPMPVVPVGVLQPSPPGKPVQPLMNQKDQMALPPMSTPAGINGSLDDLRRELRQNVEADTANPTGAELQAGLEARHQKGEVTEETYTELKGDIGTLD